MKTIIRKINHTTLDLVPGLYEVTMDDTGDAVYEYIDDEGDWQEEWMADGDLLFHPCGPSGGRC